MEGMGIGKWTNCLGKLHFFIFFHGSPSIYLLYRSPHYRKMQHGTSKKGSKYSLAVLLHTSFCLNKRPTDGGEKWSAKQYCQLCLKTYSIWVCNIKNPCSGRFDVGVWFGGYGSRHGHFTSDNGSAGNRRLRFSFSASNISMFYKCVFTQLRGCSEPWRQELLMQTWYI